MSEPTVLIAGAGLGGLSLAQALLGHGIPVQLFERDATPWDRPQGYRLHLEADALHALREVLPPERHALFRATAMRTTAFTTILNTSLEVVKQIPTDDGQDAEHWPQYVSDENVHCNVDRATLREILLDGLEEHIHFGRQVASYESTADGVTVAFADGTTAHGTILVGADGIRSAVRAQRAPNLRTMDAGVQAIYGRIPWEAAVAVLPDAVLQDIFAIGMDNRKVFLGLGAVDFPTEPSAAARGAGRPCLLEPRGRYAVCIVGGRHEHFPHSHDELRAMPPARLQDVALSVLTDWPEPARHALAAAEPESFFSVGMDTSVPGQLERHGTVTLLGDAVHAMTPTLGRGANLAMRDGALLSRRLKRVADGTSTVAEALAAYEDEMVAYGFDVVRESVRMGEQRMSQNPLPR
ncbi:NAD(P)/FAD-dependent oxidoreductase [Actinoplanes sp. NBRC 103695]|uniref:FAD-dependent oxidoreductase n=1 Tax=Actinoplanes sp. NBRC 103695 TaxID=3032202 RepID=UPI0024A21591|nr:NAD(P)/FAD-dependent oxidoreductase [Actinoplanes sp. NBRC 103695]GLY94011.1 FAD-dependent oxidoreductase [Actinoplanes sp. NBRC 103695]